MSQRLNVGDVITNTGVEMVILTLKADRDEVILFTPKSQTTHSMGIKELRRQLAEGLVTTSAAIASHGTLRDFEVDSPAFSRFLYNDAVVKRIKHLAQGGRTVREAIKVARETMIELASGRTMPMCSDRQAYRLLRLADDHKIALLPTYSARGNRIPRYCDRVKEIALQAIKDHYAIEKSRFSLPKLTDVINAKAHAEGVLAVESRIDTKHIKKVLVNSWNADMDYGRLDPRIAKSAKAVAKQRINPGPPLNRVEMDGLHLPFVATYQNRIIENLWLLHAIDCGSSHPLSWRLLREKPTTDDTFSCIERAIYPKADVLTKMGIKFKVDPFGSIMNLVMDNGQENSKPRLANLTKVGINPQWTEVNSGHRKPFIERLNRSLKTALEILPGCTRFNGKDGERKAQALQENLLTFEELEHWIVRWMFEVWADHPLERFVTADFDLDQHLGYTPADRWKNYEKEHSLPLCPTREAWHRVKFLSGWGSLSAKTGITHDTFTFRGPKLPHLVHQYGPNCKVQFFYDPHDYRSIYVPDKETGTWVELVNSEVTSHTPAFCFVDAKERRAEQKSAYKASEAKTKFAEDIVEKSTEKPTKRQAKESARKEEKRSERARQANDRARKKPMSEDRIEQPNADTYVAADAAEKLTKHKKTDRTKE